MPDMFDMAMTYITPNGKRHALPIFPLTDTGKEPRISKANGGHGCKDASTDENQIGAWWTRWPNANIGIATGAESGLLVIDVDNKHGADGDETLREMEATLGKLPDSWEALTPNGGRHLYFRYPADSGISIHAYKADRGDPWPGIDIRGQGGYVVAPPSEIKADDGTFKAYEWELSSVPSDTDLADLPEKWVKCLQELCSIDVRRKKAREPFTLPDPKTVLPGSRNETLFGYACSLRMDQGKDEAAILQSLRDFNAQLPDPLPESELDRITESAGKYPAGKTRSHKERMTLEIVSAKLSELGYSVRFNEVSRMAECQGLTPAGFALNEESLAVLLHDALSGEYSGASLETIRAYLAFLASENRYNPVRELLAGTVWDGVDRLPSLYDVAHIQDDASRTFFRKWLLQTCAALFNGEGGQEPFSLDAVLTLVGAQGTGKTSLFRALALKTAWFSEGTRLDERDKDTFRRAVTCWICELGEVDSTMKSDLSAVKAFISSPWDAYRLPFGRADVTGARHASLCATCNFDRYLIDQTGNRRFWTVEIPEPIDRAALESFDFLQLWAQLYSVVAPLSYADKARCFRLTREEMDALNARNAQHQKPVKAQSECEDIIDEAKRNGYGWREMTVLDFKLLWHDELRNFSVQQIGTALQALGIETEKTKKARLRMLPTKVKAKADDSTGEPGKMRVFTWSGIAPE